MRSACGGVHLHGGRRSVPKTCFGSTAVHLLSRVWLECSLRLLLSRLTNVRWEDSKQHAAVEHKRCDQMEHDRLLWRSRRWLWRTGRTAAVVAVVPYFLPHTMAASPTDGSSVAEGSLRTSICSKLRMYVQRVYVEKQPAVTTAGWSICCVVGDIARLLQRVEQRPLDARRLQQCG